MQNNSVSAIAVLVAISLILVPHSSATIQKVSHALLKATASANHTSAVSSRGVHHVCSSSPSYAQYVTNTPRSRVIPFDEITHVDLSKRQAIRYLHWFTRNGTAFRAFVYDLQRVEVYNFEMLRCRLLLARFQEPLLSVFPRRHGSQCGRWSASGILLMVARQMEEPA